MGYLHPIALEPTLWLGFGWEWDLGWGLLWCYGGLSSPYSFGANTVVGLWMGVGFGVGAAVVLWVWDPHPMALGPTQCMAVGAASAVSEHLLCGVCGVCGVCRVGPTAPRVAVVGSGGGELGLGGPCGHVGLWGCCPTAQTSAVGSPHGDSPEPSMGTPQPLYGDSPEPPPHG